MKRFKKILFLALMVAALSCLFCQPAFAISEEEVQAQVDAVGKEAVSGNVLIWFMCAIGFLKVSQKIDSFMASLGVNVGHTGGSMLAEAMIAAKGIGGFKNFSSHHFGGGRSSSSTHVNASGGGGRGGAGFGAGFASGGLAGVIKRNVTNNAVKTATTPSDTKPSGLGGLVGGAAGGVGGHIYSSSVSKGGSFANNVIGSVATGNITQMGTITGEKAVEALHSYMGHTALGAGAENMKRFLSRLRRPLCNERGEITFFACFFVVGVVMLISFLLLYASVRITCINIRNGAKMELNNLSATIYADT